MKRLECGCTTEAGVDNMIKDMTSLLVHSAHIHNICRESIHYAMVRLFHRMVMGIADNEEEYQDIMSTLQEDIASVHKIYGMEKFQKETRQ